MLACVGEIACDVDQHRELVSLVNCGMLYEVNEWIDSGKPTLRPQGKKGNGSRFSSSLHQAIDRGNHSLVRLLWERASQDEAERSDVLWHALGRHQTLAGREIARYLLQNGCPVAEDFPGSYLFLSHDEDLIHLGIDRGVQVAGEGGFNWALSETGSKWLVGFYRRNLERYPDLEREAVISLAYAIKNRKVRLVALLRWAGVDPFYVLEDETGEFESWKEGEPIPAETYVDMPVSELMFAMDSSEVLDVLKLRPNPLQWVYLMEHLHERTFEQFKRIYTLRNDARKLFGHYPEALDMLARRSFRRCGWDLFEGRYQEHYLELSYFFVSLGGDPLGSDEQIGDVRRSLYLYPEEEALVRLLTFIHERSTPTVRAKLKILVKTGKMFSIVKRYNPWLLYDLGLLDTKTKLRWIEDLPRWKPESYALPAPWNTLEQNYVS